METSEVAAKRLQGTPPAASCSVEPQPSRCAVAAVEPKPFQGGYRNVRTGAHYHHAATQTLLPDAQQQCSQVCSDTQTAEVKSRSAQTQANAATQCPRPGWYEDTSADRILVPTAGHQTTPQLVARKEAAARTIQRWLRGWHARRRAAEMQAAKRALDEYTAAQEAQQAQQQEESRQAEVRRRMQPRSSADFAILHKELAAWWRQETAQIKGADADEEAKQEALQMLLAKETRLLQTIDKLKIAAAGSNRAARVEGLLQRLASPKQWVLASGAVVAVQTPGTLRAAELAGVYHNLVAADGGDINARLTALMQVKQTLKGGDSSSLPAAKAVLELVDRELDLLNRGRSPVGMEGLRQRVANSFLEALKCPQLNPEAVLLGFAASNKAQAYKFTHRNGDYQQVCRSSVAVQTA